MTDELNFEGYIEFGPTGKRKWHPEGGRNYKKRYISANMQRVKNQGEVLMCYGRSSRPAEHWVSAPRMSPEGLDVEGLQISIKDHFINSQAWWALCRALIKLSWSSLNELVAPASLLRLNPPPMAAGCPHTPWPSHSGLLWQAGAKSLVWLSWVCTLNECPHP